MFLISINKGCRLTREGREYRGNISVAQDHNKCQAWASQTPRQHEMTDRDLFPDHTIEEAQNFCRNPDGDPLGPWCYTMKRSRKERCIVPYCDSINTRMIYV